MLKEMSWVEKYRPNTVDNVIGGFKDKIKKYISNQETLPNFLFYSRTPGTGKTTLAKAIIKDLGCDYLILNASDDRTLDTVREKVKSFAVSMSSKNIRRCCFLDEFDGMLPASQNALKSLMEMYTQNVFFILTCNNIEKIIEPIQSRCTLIEFSNLSKIEIKEHLIQICQKENVTYDAEGIQKVIDIYYPSVRNMVKTLQDISILGKDVVVNNVSNPEDVYIELFDLIKKRKYLDVKRRIIEEDIDVELFNKFIFGVCMKGTLPIKQEIRLIPCCARNVKHFSMGADKLPIFFEELLNMMSVFKEE